MPPLRIDRYEVLGQLGKGSNGIVYLARDPRVGREVAIKVINPARMKEAIVQQRFHREAKAIARLHHPNIMQLLDYSGPNAPMPYLVVERLHGKNLDDVLTERGQPLDGPTAAAVVHEICLALHHAHTHNIVHRDLKPENVFIEPEGRVVLCDFGIARSYSADESGTLAGRNTRLAGSPLYMSPEQIATPQSVGPASDLFALGSLLYYLVTLKHAFLADSVVSVLKRIAVGAPDSLRTARPHLPERYYRVVEKLHQHAADKRYPSASALTDALTLVVKEAGHADPRRALKTALQTLGRTSARISRSEVIGVEQMDEEAKTVVLTLVPKEKKPAEAPPAKAPRRDRTAVWAVVILLLAVALSIVLVAGSLKPEQPPPPLPLPLPTPAPGTLRLTVQPGADVYVDERKLGASNEVGPVPLPPGTHQLRLVHPKLGRFEQAIEIQAGHDTVLSVDLKKK